MADRPKPDLLGLSSWIHQFIMPETIVQCLQFLYPAYNVLVTHVLLRHDGAKQSVLVLLNVLQEGEALVVGERREVRVFVALQLGGLDTALQMHRTPCH